MRTPNPTPEDLAGPPRPARKALALACIRQDIAALTAELEALQALPRSTTNFRAVAALSDQIAQLRRKLPKPPRPRPPCGLFLNSRAAQLYYVVDDRLCWPKHGRTPTHYLSPEPEPHAARLARAERHAQRMHAQQLAPGDVPPALIDWRIGSGRTHAARTAGVYKRTPLDPATGQRAQPVTWHPSLSAAIAGYPLLSP